VLELAPRRREIGVPDLGQPPAGELHVALVERRVDLQEQQGLLDVQHSGHEPPTIAPGARFAVAQRTAARVNERTASAANAAANRATTARLSHASAVVLLIPQMSCRPLPLGSTRP
jgi:hypothetical protein